MKPSAVLLIDLENFFLSRVQYFNEKAIPQTGRPSFARDFERLIAFAQRMAGVPFAVRRAYADYVTLRVGPRELMRQGVEPVQVFRLSGARSGSKNAADMRMAMDATALLASAGHAEHFVLVTGDADFIPVILELKRHGRAVSVIGVTGATNELIQRFVDNFELFEDLLAAEEVEARSGELALTGDGMEKVATAIRRLLARNRPLRFAAIKPLLSRDLDAPFDPGAFGCDTTGDFLRKYERELGVVIRQGQHDSEIDLPGAPVPGANGTGHGSKVAPKPAARPPNPPAAKPAEPHTAEHYRQLLAGRGQTAGGAGTVKVPAVPWPVLVWGCDAVVALLAPPAGAPTHTTSLLPKLLRAADDAPVPDLVKHLRLFYPTLRAGLPVQGADGVYSLPADSSAEHIRRSVLSYIAFVLTCRLAENAVVGDLRPEALAAALEPGAALEQATAEVVAALAQPAPVPESPKARKPAPSVEEAHTPANYLKLLKLGGARGSETEGLKILPVPWPSVERVCADAFPLLCPAAGGGSLPREQLNVRLTEAGNELCVERYDQHVRRVLGLLRVAGELNEENGALALNADIAAAPDLRNRALAFLLQLLQLRLEEREQYDPIRPQAFVAAIEAGPLSDRLAEEVAPVIAWLYRPAEDDPEPVAAVPEPAAEYVGSEAVPVAQFDTAGPDSGMVEVGVELVETETGLARDPAPAEAPADPTEPSAEPSWDPYAFDGALPDGAAPREVSFNAPAAFVRTDPTPIPAAESPSAVFGNVDVAVITREAVAEAAVEALPLTGVVGAKGFEPPEPEPFAFPPPAPELAAEVEEILTAVPVGDWLPDGDPLDADPFAPEQLVARAPPRPLAPIPPPLPGSVAKILPPPLPAGVQPPPLPPLPPESA